MITDHICVCVFYTELMTNPPTNHSRTCTCTCVHRLSLMWWPGEAERRMCPPGVCWPHCGDRRRQTWVCLARTWVLWQVNILCILSSRGGNSVTSFAEGGVASETGAYLVYITPNFLPPPPSLPSLTGTDRNPLVGAEQEACGVPPIPSHRPSAAVIDITENMRAKIYILCCKMGESMKYHAYSTPHETSTLHINSIVLVL